MELARLTAVDVLVLAPGAFVLGMIVGLLIYSRLLHDSRKGEP